MKKPKSRVIPTQTENDLIAQYLRDKGPTKCPTAFAAPTSTTVNPDDAKIHKDRGLDPVGAIFRRKPKRGGWATYWAKKRGITL